MGFESFWLTSIKRVAQKEHECDPSNNANIFNWHHTIGSLGHSHGLKMENIPNQK